MVDSNSPIQSLENDSIIIDLLDHSIESLETCSKPVSDNQAEEHDSVESLEDDAFYQDFFDDEESLLSESEGTNLVNSSANNTTSTNDSIRIESEVNSALTVENKSCQTEFTNKDLQELLLKLESLQLDNIRLQAKLKRSLLSQDSFVGDNNKTLFFTGLHRYEVLFAIHEEVCSHLYTKTNVAISTFEQLLLTLMKLRLNLSFKDLSYR